MSDWGMVGGWHPFQSGNSRIGNGPRRDIADRKSTSPRL
jgi:hypothetical protein